MRRDYFLASLKGIENDEIGLYSYIVDAYLEMLTRSCNGIQHLTNKFHEFAQTEEFSGLPANLRFLLISMAHFYPEGHSYLAFIDIRKKEISFVDYLAIGRVQQWIEEHQESMDRVTECIEKLEPGTYSHKVITDLPQCAQGPNCLIYTCQFAKCIATDFDYHRMPIPDRRTIVYEILKGEPIRW